MIFLALAGERCFLAAHQYFQHMFERRIVITGIGVLTPIGNNLEDFWKNTLAGKSGVRTIQSMDTTNYDCKIGGEVVDFDPTPWFNNHKEARRADRFRACRLRWWESG